MRIVSITVLLLTATVLARAGRADQVQPSRNPPPRGAAAPYRAYGQSEKSSWSLRSLWPFGGNQDKVRNTARREIPWNRIEASRPRPIDPATQTRQQPSALQRFASRTKESWQRATRRLTPNRTSLPKGSNWRPQGRSEPSLYERWFGARPKDNQQPQSVGDFIKQPRPSAGSP